MILSIHKKTTRHLYRIRKRVTLQAKICGKPHKKSSKNFVTIVVENKDYEKNRNEKSRNTKNPFKFGTKGILSFHCHRLLC